MRPAMRWCAVGFVMVLALSCGSSEEGSARAAVEGFFDRLNDGDYSGAIAYYDAQMQETMSGAGSSFGDWARGLTKNGSVDRVEILNEDLDEDRGEIRFELIYTDGSKRAGSVKLRMENGAWKLGAVS